VAKERGEMADKEAKEKGKRDAKKAEDQTKKEAKKEAMQVAKEANKGAGAELHQGTVRLTIAPPVDSDQLRRLEEQLYQVEDL
jgi:hypothetical protein